MPEVIELEDVDMLAAGAVGVPGERTFLIQARRGSTQLTVLVEKEQVAILAREANALVDRLDADFPVGDFEPPRAGATVSEPVDPLFRARTIGLGYDPERQRVLIELREQIDDDEDDDEFSDSNTDDGWVARVYATRSQVRAMAEVGAAAVVAGRPTCDLCGFPMDPGGHICPRWN